MTHRESAPNLSEYFSPEFKFRSRDHIGVDELFAQNLVLRLLTRNSTYVCKTTGIRNERVTEITGYDVPQLYIARFSEKDRSEFSESGKTELAIPIGTKIEIDYKFHYAHADDFSRDFLTSPVEAIQEHTLAG